MTLMLDLFVSFILLGGAAAILCAAVGFVRFRDSWMRSCAVSVATTLGIVLVLTGTTIAGHGEWLKALVIIWFVMLSTPVAGHLLMRAVWVRGQPMILGSTSKMQAPGIHRSAGNSDPNTSPSGHT